jgi:hypothetical protein
MGGHLRHARLDPARFHGMRRPGANDEDQHQARQKRHELVHAVPYHLTGKA